MQGAENNGEKEDQSGADDDKNKDDLIEQSETEMALEDWIMNDDDEEENRNEIVDQEEVKNKKGKRRNIVDSLNVLKKIFVISSYNHIFIKTQKEDYKKPCF